jgi:diguanylate cyclase (GGDEF)-like protein
MGALASISPPPIGGEVFDNSILNMLLPMHIQLDSVGKIVHVGPTLAKLFLTGTPLEGQYLFKHIQFNFPKNLSSFDNLKTHYGSPLIAQLHSHKEFDLKAVAVPMPHNTGVLVNFAFGTSLKEAVSFWNLNGKDFSPTDPSVEMLYVIEVQSALLEESQSLNDRLNGQREEAEEKAYTDPLTGLSNRRALDRYMKRFNRRRKPSAYSLFLIDLDHFKLVNDTLGHSAGDKVLQDVAEILLNETRPTDIVVRSGGDEFLLVLEGDQTKEQLEDIAKRIICKIKRPISWGAQKCYVGASIGIVNCHTKRPDTIEYYLQTVDEALYVSKKDGRGRYCFAP